MVAKIKKSFPKYEYEKNQLYFLGMTHDKLVGAYVKVLHTDKTRTTIKLISKTCTEVSLTISTSNLKKLEKFKLAH